VYTVSSSGDVKGFVKIGVHYFEDGNVQLHTNVEHAAKVTTSVSQRAQPGQPTTTLRSAELCCEDVRACGCD